MLQFIFQETAGYKLYISISDIIIPLSIIVTKLLFLTLKGHFRQVIWPSLSLYIYIYTVYIGINFHLKARQVLHVQ